MRPPVHNTNIFSVIASIAFIITIFVCGGLFAYKHVLTGQIAQAENDLVAARAAFEPDTIQKLISVSSEISSAKRLLEQHVVVSEIFSLLQNITVKKVQFDDFSYSKKDKASSISMSGAAQNYSALRAQADLFSQSDFIKNPVFSNFDLAENGNVTFKFESTIDPTLISYKKAVSALSATNPQ